MHALISTEGPFSGGTKVEILDWPEPAVLLVRTVGKIQKVRTSTRMDQNGKQTHHKENAGQPQYAEFTTGSTNVVRLRDRTR